MKSSLKRALSLVLSLVLALGLVPAGSLSFPATAASVLANGTVIYYEDFNYADNADSASVLSALGWTRAEELRTNQANYSISGGKLLCDTISSGATGDSYVTLLDDAAMSEVAKGDYTITYKLKYVEADSYTRYNCLVYNYNGYKSYNSVHLRIAGYGNNQVRSAAKWYDYDSSASSYYMKATGTSSISYKLFGTSASSADASTTTNYPFAGKELTVRIVVDIDAGPTVYVNETKVSVPAKTYKQLFLSTQVYAQAIALKTTRGVRSYIDDVMVYTGTGAIPTGVTKDSVTYQRPVAEECGRELKVMSFNTLFSDQSADVFGDGITRTYHMYNVVSGLHPDIVGFQERSEENLAGITDLLVSDAGYAVADNYRTDTTVSNVISYVPILYNKSKYSLVANSAANNNVAHGALLFDKSYNVIGMTAAQIAAYAGTKGLAWAVLKDKETGGYILALNAHFALNLSSYTNYSAEQAREARLSNAAQAYDVMDKVYAVFGVIPTVFTGDFNMRLNDPSYKYLNERLSDAIYADTDFIKYEYSMNSITDSSFTRAPNVPIDHIFYTTQSLTPVEYTVCNQSPEMRIASDHIAVISVFRVEETVSPQCSHSTGIYDTVQKVTLTGDGEIYYTTDNSDPKTSITRKLYPGAIAVTEDTVIRYCAKNNGVYSPVERVTLFFGNPIYITEVIKNAPGTDFCEGLEIINVSGAPVDLSDFYLWQYNDTDEAACQAVSPDDVSSQLKMAYTEGESVIPSGAIAFCPIVHSSTYMEKEKLSGSKTAYLVTVNDGVTKVTYHKDLWAQAIAYDGSGNIAPDLILPIDRTARSIGYTESGTLAKRFDYFSETDGSVNNITASFNLSNSSYTNLYITFKTAQSVSEAICVINADSTGGGSVTNSDSTVTCNEGAYNFLPTSTAKMTTVSFTKGSYTIGSLTAEQQTAFDKLVAKRFGKTSKAIRNEAEFASMTAGSSYYLAADITLSASYSTKFTGVLDGRGYTVTTTVPMFDDMSGTVKNLTVNGTIVADGTYNGAVASKATGNAKFENIVINATLSGGTSTGGLVGYGVDGNTIIATKCINNGNHSGTGQVGGLIGYTQGTTLYIDGCINKGDITSTAYCAGIVCRFGKDASTVKYTCVIVNSENYGNVTAAGNRSAGIVAYNAGIITIGGCTNYGDIGYTGTVQNFVAGGIYGTGGSTYTSGTTELEVVNSLTINDCFNHGKVKGTACAAGIAGRISTAGPTSGYLNTIVECGNTGEISTVDAGSAWGTKGAGGIIGYLYGSSCKVLRCYNVGNISVTNDTNTVVQRASGLIAYFSNEKPEIKYCYNAGTVTATGAYAEAYQLYCNNNATGATTAYLSNNFALAVSGATYEKNGTQTTASYSTFTSAYLANGTLKKKLNTAAGETCFHQSVGNEAYPVLREYKAVSVGEIILAPISSYRENGKQIYRVSANTAVGEFMGEFLSDVFVYDSGFAADFDKKMATGFKVTSFDGADEMTVAVVGDIDGDGELTSNDYTLLKGYFKGVTVLDDVQKLAAETSGNAVINVTDYILIKRMICGTMAA